jgi:hypothetical protein
MKQLILLAAVFCAGCASYLQMDENLNTEYFGSVCIKTDHTGNNNINIILKYKSYDYLINEVKNTSKKLKRQQHDIDSAVNAQPAGGYLMLEYQSQASDSADPKNFDYIVQDSSGTTIMTAEGSHSVPENITTQYYTMWKSFDIVPLPEAQHAPFKVAIQSTVFNTITNFIVYPNKIGMPPKSEK